MIGPPESFYKWAFGMTFALLVGVLVGQYTPNRNIVLRDELLQAQAAQKVSTDALTESNKELSTRLQAVEKQLASVDTTLKLTNAGTPANPVRLQ